MIKLIAILLVLATVYCKPQNGKFLLSKHLLNNRNSAQPVDSFDFNIPEERNISPVAPVPSQVRVGKNYMPNKYEIEQNQNARYEFMSDVDDHISDLTQTRSETRDGLKVDGMYSYSDGFYKRTVHYTADENGYRVTGMEAVPLTGGPQVDLSGTASVSNAAHGTHVSYKVQSVPVEGPVGKIIEN